MMTRLGARGVVPRGEGGAALIMFTILLVVLFTILAIVIDLGMTRKDTRESQTIADFAVAAGAYAMDPLFGGTPYDGCVAAWDYFVANTPGASPSASHTCATTYPPGVYCDPAATPAPPPMIAGQYKITITVPVQNDSPLMGTNGLYSPEIDGAPCERIAIEVRLTRDALFSGVVGAATNGSIATAVARTSGRTNSGDVASLIVLDTTGCNALTSSGQGKLRVVGKAHPVTGDIIPGVITVDSAGTEGGNPPRRCTNVGNDFTIYVSGQNVFAEIKACGNVRDPANLVRCDPGGIIFSHALMPGNGNQFAYDPAQVPISVYPQPLPGQRITRGPFDHRYNCKSSYPTYMGITIEPCNTPTGAAHIDQLQSEIGQSGTPAGFTSFTSVYGTNVCQNQLSDFDVPAGNWHIDCTKFEVGGTVIFRGGNLVFDSGIDVKGGALCINIGAGTCAAPQPSSDAWLFIRKKTGLGQPYRFAKGPASVTLAQTMVFISEGDVTFGSSGALHWTAPLAGKFEDLALWSEHTTLHNIGGQAGLMLEGAFFVPHAQFQFDGQADYLQTKAQFVAQRIDLSGQGLLIMEPDPTRVVLIPLQGVRLIR